MGLNIFLIAIIILILFAVFDLMVGVTNDAVNFLNSSIGSKVAPRYVIMIIASLGILAGVTFSSGMMEVARKGIFHPQFFTMPELLTIFLAVMITDIILLDIFNTFGLPTSTTVSIVFELLGAAVAASIIKIVKIDGSLMSLGQYINSSKAMMIIMGILLSVVVAFFFGALAQLITRVIFTFDYLKRMRRYGAIWGGAALASITFFIFIKGAKGASFVTPEFLAWLKAHSWMILLSIFVASTIILQILMMFFRVNILKIIILVGTFALAMAFAANDLVNFIGVPLAGLFAYKAATGSGDPLNLLMSELNQKVQVDTYLLIIAGIVMVITLCISKKTRTVTDTEVSLGQQDEGIEKFESTSLSRIIVRMVLSFFETTKVFIPMSIRSFLKNRIDPEKSPAMAADSEQKASFDFIRASVNLMVASAVVSFATSLKLPLSTTYVTFMVAMGTSFSDGAWGRESAVYRVTGVITVIGGWFMTAFMAFTVSFIFANIINYFQAYGVLFLLGFVIFVIWRTHRKHQDKLEKGKQEEIFNLKKVKDPNHAISSTFQHMAKVIREIRESLDISFEALFTEDLGLLRKQKRKIKLIQKWINIITANIFKTLRIMQKSNVEISYKYAQTIRRLQKLSDGHRDIILRSYSHVGNKHKGLLPEQIEELKTVKDQIVDILYDVQNCFENVNIEDYQKIIKKYEELWSLAERTNNKQIERINDGESKTRLSILFYALIGNTLMLSKQNLKLLEIFQYSFDNK